MANIVLDGVTKVFGDEVIAVNNVSLEIEEGEFMVLVGPSGCGKSTILRILAGLEEVTAGELSIDGKQVTDLPPKDRDIAMVFQNYALYPHMTVAQNLGFGLRLRKTPKDEYERRVRDVATILGLEPLLHRKPAELSGGQRQRVAMGRAMVREPVAFLMDEPLSNLDAKLRVQMRAELARVHERLGTTTVYVTHDQTEAMTMGDRVAVLKKGELQQVDAPQFLYDHPTNLFVAGFIGSPAMNMVEADLVREDGGLYATFGSTRLRVADEVVSERPGIRAYEGRRVIAGIRPENMEDASIMPVIPVDRRMKVDIVLREALGAEVLVHFTVDAPPVLTDDTRELVGEQSGPMAQASVIVQDLEKALETGTSTFVARLDPRTRAAERQPLELAVDTARLHFFDPQTGLGIYGDET
jgi:multiple sugar transport system ATP-binding protein